MMMVAMDSRVHLQEQNREGSASCQLGIGEGWRCDAGGAKSRFIAQEARAAAEDSTSFGMTAIWVGRVDRRSSRQSRLLHLVRGEMYPIAQAHDIYG
jgi:hypothetical protein